MSFDRGHSTWVGLAAVALMMLNGCDSSSRSNPTPSDPDASSSMAQGMGGPAVDSTASVIDAQMIEMSDAMVAEPQLDTIKIDASMEMLAAMNSDAGIDAAIIPPDAAIMPGPTVRGCFEPQYLNETDFGPDYDQFEPTVGSHCLGTNHQDIDGVERVVFIGDSVTVGTPPQNPAEYFRYLLANRLAQRLQLMPPDPVWANVNLIDGGGLVRTSGAFSVCAKYGARTDDLMEDNSLLTDCVSAEDRERKTLFIMTMGGNDIASLTKAGLDGETPEQLWERTRKFVRLMREGVQWLKSQDNFPNGSFVVFSNMFEFTDGTGDVTACPAAGLAGFGAEWEDTNLLKELVSWANEQYLVAAIEENADMIFMLEHFCGHGFNAAEPRAPCYRGANSEVWFDLTCTHPNTAGHAEIAKLFEATILE